MFGWLAGCVLPFPPSPDSPVEGDTDTDVDTDADSDVDTDADSDTDTEPLVELEADRDATASLSGWYTAAGALQADADAADELLVMHRWVAELLPSTWWLHELEGPGIRSVPGFVDVPFAVGTGTTCLDDGNHPQAAFVQPSGADGADVDGDGFDDLVVGLPSAQNGGGIVVLVYSELAPLADGGPDRVTEWCFPGQNTQLGQSVLIVEDGGEGTPVVVASLAKGSNDVAGIAVFDVAAPDTTPLVADAVASTWVTLSTMLQGGSFGGSIEAVDFDQDGEPSWLIGTEGDPPYDPATVYQLEDGPLGTYDGDNASDVLLGRVLGQPTVPPISCGGLAAIVTADIDDDGADDAVLGFPQDDRVTVLDGGTSTDVYAAEIPAGATGTAETCFGAAVAVVGEPGSSLVAVSAPVAHDDDGEVWLFDAFDLSLGVLEAATDARVRILPRGTGLGAEQLGTTLVDADVDGDGIPDLVVSEGASGDDSRVFVYSGTDL